MYIWGGRSYTKEKKVPNLNIEQQILKYGKGKDNDYICELISLEEDGLYFKLKSPVESKFFLPLLGEHNIYNATGAILVARYLDIPMEIFNMD